MKQFLLALFILFITLGSHAQTYDGIWKTAGYGFAFSIDSQDLIIYDVTSISAVPSFEGAVIDDSVYIDGDFFGLLVDTENGVILDRLDGNFFELSPMEELVGLLEVPTTDPLINFDVLWTTHNEWSALFDVLDLDWQAVYDTYRPQINDSTSAEDLFLIFEEMLENFNDGHISLIDFENEVGYSGGPDANPYWDPEGLGFPLIQNIAATYLDDFTLAPSGLMGYGTIDDSIAYLNVASMAGYADGTDFDSDDEAFRAELIEILDALADKSALILDIRFNGGGDDVLGRTLAGYLTDQVRPVYSKAARNGGPSDFTSSNSFFIEPQEKTYFLDKPIIALTSDFTASAAEILTMCLNQIPNLTTMGEATYGIFSDGIPKTLPNGWFYTFSPERYLTVDGLNLEQQGVAPDIQELGDTNLLAQGIDNILERAIDALQAIDYSGLYRTLGYGFAFEIDSQDIQIYDITSISAVPSFGGALIGDSLYIDEEIFGVVSPTENGFIIDRLDGNIMELIPMGALTGLINEPTTDALTNFDIFWHTHNEWTALFDVLDLDWQGIYDTYRSQITDNTSNEELFEILVAMLDNFNDGHSGIVDFETGIGFGGGPDASPFWNPEDLGIDLIQAIAGNYLDDFIVMPSELMAYGTIDDTIGYINVLSMADFNENVDGDISDLEAFRIELVEVLEQLQDNAALIIDLRFNGGGSDEIGRLIADYLTDETRFAYSKAAREGGPRDFTDSISFFIQPQEKTYFLDKPVIALTSDFTASASEIATMSLNQVPNLTTIGEATYGIFSDVIPKTLPNGWAYFFSPERYLTADGINYEQQGLPPDIFVQGDTIALADGIDNILERALEELQGVITSTNTLELVKEINIYPNPVQDILAVDFNLINTGTVEFQLFQNGQLILRNEQSYLNGSNHWTFNMADFTPGPYSLRIINNGQVKNMKVLKL